MIANYVLLGTYFDSIVFAKFISNNVNIVNIMHIATYVDTPKVNIILMICSIRTVGKYSYCVC